MDEDDDDDDRDARTRTHAERIFDSAVDLSQAQSTGQYGNYGRAGKKRDTEFFRDRPFYVL